MAAFSTPVRLSVHMSVCVSVTYGIETHDSIHIQCPLLSLERERERETDASTILRYDVSAIVDSRF